MTRIPANRTGIPCTVRDFSDLAVLYRELLHLTGIQVWRKLLIVSQIMSKNDYTLKM